MPLYEWECADCKKITEVINSFKDSEVPPEKCSSKDCVNVDPTKFKKLIGSTNFQLMGRGWASDGYS